MLALSRSDGAGGIFYYILSFLFHFVYCKIQIYVRKLAREEQKWRKYDERIMVEVDHSLTT